VVTAGRVVSRVERMFMFILPFWNLWVICPKRCQRPSRHPPEVRRSLASPSKRWKTRGRYGPVRGAVKESAPLKG